MKRILAIILCVLMIAPVCVFSVSANEKADLYASVLRFDNFKDNSKIKYVSGENAEFNVNLYSYPSEVPDAWDYEIFSLDITGTGLYTVSVDASSIDFSKKGVEYVVINGKVDFSKLSVVPVLKNGDKGETCEYTVYNEVGFYKLSAVSDLQGIEITALEAELSWNLSEIFFCANEYSAKFIIDNRVLPSDAESKELFIESEEHVDAIDTGDIPNDELYHDFDNAKWPNIAVDENDHVYVVADGTRTPAHSDFIEAALIATSEDGGRSFSNARRLFNTMHGASPSIIYLGNGKMIAHLGVDDPKSALPGGSEENLFKNVPHGGIRDVDIAGMTPSDWDSVTGYPVSGFLGDYFNILKYLAKYDPDHTRKTDYIITSYDYGKTWNTKYYEFKDVEDVTDGMRDLAEKYQLNSVEGLPQCPAGYGAHGPKLLSDGTIIYVGYENETTYAPDGEAVCFVSHDDGETWEYRSYIETNCYFGLGNFFEPDVCETKDGVLLCGFRSHVIYNAFSYDQGRTWTTPAQTVIEGYPPEYLVMPNGDIVVTTNWRYGNTKIYGYVSEDGGRTWSTKGIVTSVGGRDGYNDMGYPANELLSDGTIITAYYTTGDTTHIQTVRWTYELIDRKPNTWCKNKTGWYYYDEDLNIVTDSWVPDSQGLCYVDSTGYLVTAKSVRYNRKCYLVDKNGHKVTKPGWNQIGSDWYYVNSDSTLVTNTWMKDSKGWCFLLSNGAMAKNRSVQDTKGYCLVDGSGYWVTKTGWQKAGSDWYYVEKGGYLKTGGWMKDSKGWCYLDYDGMMKKDQVVADSKGWCIVDASGYWVTKTGWKQIGTDWYYVQNGGYLLTGSWMKDSKGWCFLGSAGVMLKNTAVKDTKGWALLDKDGYWITKAGNYSVLSFLGGTYPKGYYDVGTDGYIILK